MLSVLGFLGMVSLHSNRTATESVELSYMATWLWPLSRSDTPITTGRSGEERHRGECLHLENHSESQSLVARVKSEG